MSRVWIFGLAVLIVLVILIKVESKELFGSKWSPTFRGGWGKCQVLGRPSAGDSPIRSLQRIAWLANAQSLKNKWVRPLIMAIITAVVLGCVYNMDPRIFTITVCIVWAIAFGFSNYYDFHYDKFAWIYVRENLKHHAGETANYNVMPYDL